MKPRGIIGGVAEELKETVKRTGEEVKEQVGKVPGEVVAALTGGQASAVEHDLKASERKREEEREIAGHRRVIQEAIEAGREKKEAASGLVPAQEKEATTRVAATKKSEEMPIVKPPGTKKRRFPWERVPKGAEIKDFKPG